MTLAPGTTLVRYEIPAKIGEGGMGEVYGDPLQTLDVPQEATYMDWSPDGRAIDFIVSRDGADNIWRLPLAGGREQKLTDWQAPTSLWYFAWSRDGKSLAVVRDSTSVDLVLIQNVR